MSLVQDASPEGGYFILIVGGKDGGALILVDWFLLEVKLLFDTV
jgi:hypothetical protein